MIQKKLWKKELELAFVVEADDEAEAEEEIHRAVLESVRDIEIYGVEEVKELGDVPLDYDDEDCPYNGNQPIKDYFGALERMAADGRADNS